MRVEGGLKLGVALAQGEVRVPERREQRPLQVRGLPGQLAHHVALGVHLGLTHVRHAALRPLVLAGDGQSSRQHRVLVVHARPHVQQLHVPVEGHLRVRVQLHAELLSVHERVEEVSGEVGALGLVGAQRDAAHVPLVRTARVAQVPRQPAVLLHARGLLHGLLLHDREEHPTGVLGVVEDALEKRAAILPALDAVYACAW